MLTTAMRFNPMANVQEPIVCMAFTQKLVIATVF